MRTQSSTSAKNRVNGAAALVAIAMMGLNCVAWTVTAADKPKKVTDPLAQRMRLKLDASAKVLEGLAVEDADLIREGANEMAEQSRAEYWQILTDADYREFTGDFRSSMRRLKEAAEKENFDAAALEWMSATKCCLDCHKHVRSAKVQLKK